MARCKTAETCDQRRPVNPVVGVLARLARSRSRPRSFAFFAELVRSHWQARLCASRHSRSDARGAGGGPLLRTARAMPDALDLVSRPVGNLPVFEYEAAAAPNELRERSSGPIAGSAVERPCATAGTRVRCNLKGTNLNGKTERTISAKRRSKSRPKFVRSM